MVCISTHCKDAYEHPYKQSVPNFGVENVCRCKWSPSFLCSLPSLLVLRSLELSG